MSQINLLCMCYFMLGRERESESESECSQKSHFQVALFHFSFSFQTQCFNSYRHTVRLSALQNNEKRRCHSKQFTQQSHFPFLNHWIKLCHWSIQTCLFTSLLIKDLLGGGGGGGEVKIFRVSSNWPTNHHRQNSGMEQKTTTTKIPKHVWWNASTNSPTMKCDCDNYNADFNITVLVPEVLVSPQHPFANT